MPPIGETDEEREHRENMAALKAKIATLESDLTKVEAELAATPASLEALADKFNAEQQKSFDEKKKPFDTLRAFTAALDTGGFPALPEGLNAMQLMREEQALVVNTDGQPELITRLAETFPVPVNARTFVGAWVLGGLGDTISYHGLINGEICEVDGDVDRPCEELILAARQAVLDEDVLSNVGSWLILSQDYETVKPMLPEHLTNNAHDYISGYWSGSFVDPVELRRKIDAETTTGSGYDGFYMRRYEDIVALGGTVQQYEDWVVNTRVWLTLAAQWSGMEADEVRGMTARVATDLRTVRTLKYTASYQTMVAGQLAALNTPPEPVAQVQTPQ